MRSIGRTSDPSSSVIHRSERACSASTLEGRANTAAGSAGRADDVEVLASANGASPSGILTSLMAWCTTARAVSASTRPQQAMQLRDRGRRNQHLFRVLIAILSAQ